MTSRYICRAYHVSDVSTQPGIVQTLHPHAMMSSGARDMMCYLSALAPSRGPCYALHDDASMTTTPLAAISWLQRPLSRRQHCTDQLFSYSLASTTSIDPEITTAPRRHGLAR